MITIIRNEQRSLWFSGAVALIAVIAYSAINPFPNYEFRTDISIGEYAVEDGFQPFESVSATELFVRDTLLILPTTDELRKFGVGEARAGAIVGVVEAGGIFRIQSVATEEQIERVRAVHKFIADGILARLKPRVEYIRSRLDARLLFAELSLKSASDNLAAFSEILADAKASEARTRDQARRLGEQIAKMPPSGTGSSPLEGAGEGNSNEAIGMGIRGQLAMYQKLGQAEIPFLRADTVRSMVALDQTIGQSRQTIKDLKNQIEVFREPAVRQFAWRSVSPTRPRLLMQLLFGLVAGLAAFFAARTYLRRASRYPAPPLT